MQRKKMLIAVLAIALLVGTVSAGLLGYYGRLTITGTVDQSVKLNGRTWDVPTEYPGIALVGGDIWRTPDIQTITNDGGSSETILLDTTVSDGDIEELGVTHGYEFRLSIPEGEAAPYGYDNLKMESWPDLTLGSITSLTLEYYLEATEAGDSPYFVLITADGAELVNDQVTDPTAVGEWRKYDALTCNWHVGFYEWSGSWADYIYWHGGEKVTMIIVGYGLWGTAVRETAWVRNILVNGYSVIDNGIIIPADSDHYYGYTYTKYDNRNIEFKVRLEFPNNFVGTFNVETKVKPA